MTHHSPAVDAGTPSSPSTTTTTASASTAASTVTLAALVGGGALVVDTVTITVINSSFGVLDDVCFLLGLLGLAVMTVALGVRLSSRARGPARLGLVVGIVVGTVVVLGGLSAGADAVGRHTFSSSNIGLHGEWSFFSIGVVMLVIAGWSARSGRQPSR